MKELKLTNSDKVCLVDDEDFERLNKFNWIDSGTTVCRIKGSHYNRKNIPISTSIEGVESLFDHKDRNYLNCQKYNLRPCTRSQNQANRGKIANTSSRFKGVCWSKVMNKWHSRITKNRIKYHLGYFDNEIEAALAYNKKALELFGEFAVLNVC